MSKNFVIKEILFDRILHKIFLILFALTGTLFGLAVPLFQNQFIKNFELSDLLLSGSLSFLSFIFFQLTNFWGQREAIYAQKKLAEQLYLKSLSYKDDTLKEKSTGEIVSLFSTDVPSSTMWLEQSIPYLLTTLFPILLAPFFLVYFYDIPIKYTAAFLVGLLLFNIVMSYRQSVFFFRFKQLAAERMSLVNEWLQNIRSIKLLNWIDFFEGRIKEKRISETNNRIQMVTNGQIMNSVSSTINFWINLFVLAVIIYALDRPFSGSELLSILWICGIFLSRPLRQLPWLLTMLFDAKTSIDRVQSFMTLQQKSEEIKQPTHLEKSIICSVNNLNLFLQNQHILKSIRFDVCEKEIVAIVGPVGSGKSLLLKSLVAELPFTADQFAITPGRSFLPQEPFIFSSSIADNVLFEYREDQNANAFEKNQDVIDSLQLAGFNCEKENMPNLEKTLIGERGLNLSGGQRLRVALARLFFRKSKFFILDEPFSALDVKTEKMLLSSFKVLKKEGSGFLISTHRFSILQHCDRIIYLNNGRIEWIGPPQQMNSYAPLLRFITSESSTEPSLTTGEGTRNG